LGAYHLIDWIKKIAPMSGRLVYLASMNLLLFTWQPPTSRHRRSDSIIIVSVIFKCERFEHCGQGYHRDIYASSNPVQ